MTKKEIKNEQIDQRLSVVKLACLLFPGAICFTQIPGLNQIGPTLFPYSILVICALAIIYYGWAFVTKKKIDSRYRKRVSQWENIVIGMLIFGMIWISGGIDSPYKFMFLFIVITGTIQLGHKQGVYIGVGCSAAILGMDLIMVRGVEVNTYFENDLILSGAFLLTAWILGSYVEAERAHICELEDMVNYDGLTKAYNHRYFYERLKKGIRAAKMTEQEVAVLFIDIDYFKHYNDINGHLEGDKVLVQVADLLKEVVGESGIVARYGGEEFAVLLPNIGHQKGSEIAEAIRIGVEQTCFNGEENQPMGTLTVSIGIANYPDKAQNDMDLIKCADDALYRAKFFDKNRVETYSSILDELEKNIDKKDLELLGSIKTLVNMINIKDRYTYGHIERVVLYSRLLADYMELDEKDTRTLVCGAYMHDVGKIDIDKDILIKKMPLTQNEWGQLKEHPSKGEEIIQYVSCLQTARPLVRHHHERYDGTGYPDRLKGEEIPFLARMLTVVDSYDAMTSNRLYNKSKTMQEAIEEIERCKGTQFDPQIAELFIKMLKERQDKGKEIE
ncbi:MAG: bifunctional diguanylate cyclase/phosphohydrolase [Cellulosilyticaceae bacterium]